LNERLIYSFQNNSIGPALWLKKRLNNVSHPSDIYSAAIAHFGHHACSLGYGVINFNVPKLFTKLKMAKADGSYIKENA
jgi:hypothetical protein